MVVYNPVGALSGGGWINSPAGAAPSEPTGAGKGHFNVSVRFQGGSAVPNGNVRFRLKTADINFVATSFDWLVVMPIDGATGILRGHGTLNGNADYEFLLTVIDGDAPGGDGIDRFQVRIWGDTTSETVYDVSLGDLGSPIPSGQGRIRLQ